MKINEIDNELAEQIIKPFLLKQRLKQQALINRIANADMNLLPITDLDKVLALRKYSELEKQANQNYVVQQKQKQHQIQQKK